MMCSLAFVRSPLIKKAKQGVQVNIVYDTGLYLRQLWCEEMNACFNTKISVRENKDALEDMEDDSDDIIKEVKENE